MQRRATYRKILPALGIFVALVAAHLSWGAVREEARQAKTAKSEDVTLVAPPSEVEALEEATEELGAVSAPNPRAAPSLDHEARDHDQRSEEPDEADRDWRVLGSPALEKSRQGATRGFLKHRIVHFTFDDGPHLENTPRLLDTLAEYEVHATFFIVGRQLGGPSSLERRALVQRMEEEGHTVASHTNAHPDLTRLSAEQMGRDLGRVEASLEATLGYVPGLFRPPYGRRNSLSSSFLRERGYTQVLWNMPPEHGARSAEDILRNFRRTLDRMEGHHRGPGGIIILHDPQAVSVDAVPLLIEELRRRNCELMGQEGEELWVMADDLRPFLLYDGELPPELIARLQADARERGAESCEDQAAQPSTEGAP